MDASLRERATAGSSAASVNPAVPSVVASSSVPAPGSASSPTSPTGSTTTTGATTPAAAAPVGLGAGGAAGTTRRQRSNMTAGELLALPPTDPALQREEEQARHDLRAFLQRLSNVIPFVTLFILRYIYNHALPIVFFLAYSLLLIKLNQHWRAQVALKQDQDRRVLIGIVLSSLLAIAAALALNAEAARAMQRPIFYSMPSTTEMGEMIVDVDGSGSDAADGDDSGDAGATTGTSGTAAGAGGATRPPLALEDVLWSVVGADVCVRLLFTAFKAIVALAPWPLYHICWRPGFLAAAAAAAPNSSLLVWLSFFRSSTSPKKGGGSHVARSSHGEDDGLLTSDNTALDMESSLHAHSRSSSSMSRASEREDRTSIYTRKRRIYCLLEGISLLVRAVMPVPVWMLYYSADSAYGDLFVFAYLTLKCMVLSRQSRSVVATLKLVCSANSLEYGRVATREEVQEVGGTRTDCPVCYDSLSPDRSVILPCTHLFCEPCLSEWMERERSCPVCRAAVQPNFEGWMLGRSRSGSTSVLPCIL